MSGSVAVNQIKVMAHFAGISFSNLCLFYIRYALKDPSKCIYGIFVQFSLDFRSECVAFFKTVAFF